MIGIALENLALNRYESGEYKPAAIFFGLTLFYLMLGLWISQPKKKDK